MPEGERLSIFGIRHHGPGSARSLQAALEALSPDLVLVEGPPEADGLVEWVSHPELIPPVAILIYVQDQPKRAAFYPFAVYSPEWQALRYAAAAGVGVRFIDLPQAFQLADLPDEAFETVAPSGDLAELTGILSFRPADPLALVAQAAGYPDGERWWERQVEQRRDNRELFAAITELMEALRNEEAGEQTRGAQQQADFENPPDITQARLKEHILLKMQMGARREARREAHMRQSIRAGLAEGYQRIAVVCGAWHAPALAALEKDPERYPEAADGKLLADLPRTNVSACWTPWSYGRLATASGYGAGIESPGWYEHLWYMGQLGADPQQTTIHWLARVAHLLRKEGLDASSAHVIEAVRLAESLAALRGFSLPGLEELNEAVRTVLLFGDDLPLRLVFNQLIVGDKLGQVPPDAPVTPLQADLANQQKRLRLKPEGILRELDLDLRSANDLERSYLLHRLGLLDIDWGIAQTSHGKSGTFHEYWRLQWQPELAVRVIEASLWGNTVAAAAENFACQQAGLVQSLPELTGLAGKALLADLPGAVSEIMRQLKNQAALASDLGQLMEALPPLAQVLRYGNVRQTDAAMLAKVVESLVVRICVGLGAACFSLDDSAAGAMFTRINSLHQALLLLQNEEYLSQWLSALRPLSDQAGLHGLLAGQVTYLLLEWGVYDPQEAARRMGLNLSLANDPARAAAWVEGFLHGSGALLLHDPVLWSVLDGWVSGLPGGAFNQILPLLRRTFATFTRPERRAIGEKVRAGNAPGKARMTGYEDFDVDLAEAALPIIARLLGMEGSAEDG